MSLALTLLQKARAQGVVIATAESCTGGMVSAAITDIAGSSKIFDRAFVTYTNTAKEQMLGVSPDTLAEHGAVSEPVAAEMADGARKGSGASLTVAITGIAGPGGSEFKPEGRVCFAVSSAEGTSASTHEFGALGRAKVRAAAKDHALRLLLNAIP